MRKTKVWLLSLAVLLIAAGSFLLPPVLFALQDRADAREADQVPMDEVDLSLISELTLVDKLTLAGDPSVSAIELSSGFGRDIDGVRDGLFETFALAGIDPADLDPFTFTARPILVINDREQSMILWAVQIQGPLLRLNAKMDDETGKVLAFDLTVLEDILEPDSHWAIEAESDKNIFSSAYSAVGEDVFYQVASLYIDQYLELYWVTLTIDGTDTMLAYIPYDEGFYTLPITLTAGSVTYIGVNM